MPEIAVQIPRYSSDVVKCARADLHARTCYIRFRKFNKMAESTPRSSVGALLRFCPHCDRWLSRNSFSEHRALYFLQESNVWKREAKVRSSCSVRSYIFHQTPLMTNLQSCPPTVALKVNHVACFITPCHQNCCDVRIHLLCSSLSEVQVSAHPLRPSLKTKCH